MEKKIDIEPIAMKAGDERVLVNGKPLSVDFRIISEDNYQLLIPLPTEPKGEKEGRISVNIISNFMDWLQENRWRPSREIGKWERTFSGREPEIVSTDDLFTHFFTK